MTHPLAGKPAPKSQLADISRLISSYYSQKPDAAVSAQKVTFGTSGHRGTSLDSTFTENHILAITQAIVDYRALNGITGPLFLGRDTHALSASAENTALGVLVANGVQCRISENDLPTPTPVISHAILTWNRKTPNALADGIIITPSHNPPEDGGFKYNPPHGGPAETAVTKWIENRANELLLDPAAIRSSKVESTSGFTTHDYISGYVDDLDSVVDMKLISASGLRIGADPLGGAALPYISAIAERWGIQLEVTSSELDPTFGFMPLDHDGKIRMDCSSYYAMANLLALQNRYDLAFANDPDADRHGIVSPSAGLINPNHFLALAIDYLFQNRSLWPQSAGIGKTLVSSMLIDRVAERLKRKVYEVPVGFKWFVPGLSDGSLGFGGEESAGASFLRFNGQPWSTDKDGVIMGLLAAEMTAKLNREPGELLQKLSLDLGLPVYRRIDKPVSPEAKRRFLSIDASALSSGLVGSKTIAGDPILQVLTKAPGNDESIGGIKVVTKNCWFAARPSGTEHVYKLYAESLTGNEAHLDTVISDASILLKPLIGE